MKNRLAFLLVLPLLYYVTSCSTGTTNQAKDLGNTEYPAKVLITVNLDSLNTLYPDSVDFTCQIIHVSKEFFSLTSPSDSVQIEDDTIILSNKFGIAFELNTIPSSDSTQILLTRFKKTGDSTCTNSLTQTLNNKLFISTNKQNCIEIFHLRGYILADNKIYHVSIDPKLKVGQGDQP